MKKMILTFLFTFGVVMYFFTIDVVASEYVDNIKYDTATGEVLYDDNNRVTSSSIDFTYDYTNVYGNGSKEREHGMLTSTGSDSYVYMIRYHDTLNGSDCYRYYLAGKGALKYSYIHGVYDASNDKWSDSGQVTSYSKNFYLTEYDGNVKSISNCELFFYGKFSNGTSYTDPSFQSGIPIFNSDNIDAVNAYISSGDISGSENYYDISKPKQDDSVELPKNVRTYGNVFETALRQASLQGRQVKYNAMTVRWDPPEEVESYSYDVKIQCTYSITSNSNLSATGRVPDLTKSKTTSAVMIVTDYPYANRGIYDLTTGKEIALERINRRTVLLMKNH